MLEGIITYKGKNTFKVKAIDYSVGMNMILSSYDYDTLAVLSAYPDRNVISDRRCNINLTNVVVATEKGEIDGKSKKLKVNNDFFCRLGSLVRYVKIHCTKRNEKGYVGLDLASGEFDVTATSDYIIPYPCEPTKTLAEVTLTYGDITSLKLNTEDFVIELKNNTALELQFPRIVDGLKIGFKVNDADYLGFPVPEDAPVESSTAQLMYQNLEEVIAAHPDKEFSWLRDKDYIIVDDEHLEEICKYIREYDGYVYYDTETSGLNINFKSRIGQADQLVGVVLSVKYGESFFFPTQMKSIKNLCNGDHFFFMEHYMRPILEGKEIVAHNGPFDWKVAYIYDINANIVHDTLTLLRLTLGAENSLFSVALKSATKVLLKRDSLELSDLLVDNKWGKSDVKFWDLPYELVRLYACADTDNTNGLLQYAKQADLLTKYGAAKVYEIELAFGFAVAYQEFYGHRLDVSNMDNILAQIKADEADLMKQMVEMVGHEFNVNSPAQLTNVLYNEMGVPKQYSKKTGNLTTDKKTLERLAEETDVNDNPRWPIVSLLMKYRQMEGVRKIADKFPERMTPDGFLFADVQQFGTTTGRVSIKDPNYQSYSDTIKKNIIPRPGYWMFDTDYSSIEYRVLGNMVGNKPIMKSFEDPDFDYHQYQAARMYRVPYNSVSKKMRKRAKGINFGLPYGMGDAALGETVFGERSVENTKKAAALRDAYFVGQEDIKEFFEFHRAKGVNLGYTETHFGRRRYYNKAVFNEAAIRRQAGNQVIQGCIQGETRVLTQDYGIVKIKDIVGLKLKVWDGEQWTVGDITYSGKKQLCKVTLSNGQVFKCSPIHKFQVVSRKGNKRFVECKDLITSEMNRSSAHRVTINRQIPTDIDWMYESPEAVLGSHNTHDYRLEQIESDYGIGVILGRLASDGSVTIQKDGKTGYISFLVAEHEYSILDELRNYLAPFNVIESDKIRDDRNQIIKVLKVCSTTLTKEIADLDIKHSLNDNIFMNLDMLRGFLRGMFDGDGGISGKTITLVFGNQANFETYCRDIQKALLFLGIRSHYRHYEGDRSVIQIKTNDNQRFLDLVGFMNDEKQEKGRQLVCIEDEHIFGPVLTVSKVEITDEWIDMYDVCNTDRGYYVADGLITHNTAADLYKLALGRIFKRICKEGWLGKVMLDAFVHDELLGEVSCEIDPGIFLKVLREEYEAKIINEDGTPWCPLYMGFGYGMNWYDAKSIELPIKLQWEIVEKYGETGFPQWTGDGHKFCQGVPDMLRDFEVRDIANQLRDPENQGKVIKQTLSNQLYGCLKTDVKACEKYKGNYEMLKTEYVTGTDIDFENLSVPDDLQEAITLYCKLHNVDRTGIDILSPDAQPTTVSEEITSAYADYDDFYNENVESEEELARLRDFKVQKFGIYTDIDNKQVYLLMPNVNEPRGKGLLSLIKGQTNNEGKGYKIIFIDYQNNMHRPTPSYLTSQAISSVQKYYISYLGGKI